MMKSPQTQIENYQSVASDYIKKAQDVYVMETASLYLLDQADQLLIKASLLNPYDEDLLADRDIIARHKVDVVRTTNTAFLPHKEILQ